MAPWYRLLPAAFTVSRSLLRSRSPLTCTPVLTGTFARQLKAQCALLHTGMQTATLHA